MSDPGNDTVSVMMNFLGSTIPVAKDLADLFLDALNTLLQNATEKSGTTINNAVKLGAKKIDGFGHEGNISLQNLVQDNKDKELLSIPAERKDLKTIQRQLKAYHVTFAVMQDPLTEGISIHVKASDYSRIQDALQSVLRDMTKDTEKVATTTVEAASDHPVETAENEIHEAVVEEPLLSEENEIQEAVVEEPVWSEEKEITIENESGDEAAQTSFTEKSADGYKLEAYSNGRANVIDAQGQTVWSSYTVPGNIKATQRLADRGLDTYKNKESLRLGQDTKSSQTHSEKFEATLDAAERTAAKEAAEGAKAVDRTTPHRLKENIR